MELLTPEYYDKFHCIAADCPDSCCKEWTVDVDSDSASFYRALSGELGDHLRSVLADTEDGTVMTIAHDRCPMWQQDGLCKIQAQLGHDALCKTCREFPRLRHDYGTFVELGLELSCPEAARLILTNQNWKLSLATVPGDDVPDCDVDVLVTLRKSRGIVLDFLDATSYTVAESLAIILLYAHGIQTEIDGGDTAVFDPAACLSTGKQLAKAGDLDSLFAFFRSLEILTPQWNSLLNSPSPVVWDAKSRNLVRYFLHRYWLQAVSDYDLICRVKLIIAGCLLINAIDREFVATAQLFSKEVENNSENVESILDGAYSSPALTDLNLLSLLLS